MGVSAMDRLWVAQRPPQQRSGRWGAGPGGGASRALVNFADQQLGGLDLEFPRFRGQVSGLRKINCRGRCKALLVIDWTEETDR